MEINRPYCCSRYIIQRLRQFKKDRLRFGAIFFCPNSDLFWSRLIGSFDHESTVGEKHGSPFLGIGYHKLEIRLGGIRKIAAKFLNRLMVGQFLNINISFVENMLTEKSVFNHKTDL